MLEHAQIYVSDPATVDSNVSKKKLNSLKPCTIALSTVQPELVLLDYNIYECPGIPIWAIV